MLKLWGIKHIFSNPYRLQGNSHVENVHNFLKRTLTTFLSSTDAEWDIMLPFTCYCFNTTPTAVDLESPFLVHGRDPLEGHTGLLGPGNIGIWAMTKDSSCSQKYVSCGQLTLKLYNKIDY